MRKIIHIAVLIESSRAFGRELIEGLCEFAQQQPDWQLHYREAATDASLTEWLENWKGDAIIARIDTKDEAEALVATGLPIVDLLGQVLDPRIPSIDTDHQAIAEMAVDFYSKAGFGSLGYCGYNGVYFSDQRKGHFVNAAMRHKGNVSVYSSKTEHPKISVREASGHGNMETIGNWLKSLPIPCGIFACNDVRALDISIAARILGLRVPEDIAILGVDDDPLICHMAHPENSSIRPDTRRQGYAGALMLSELLHQKTQPERRLTIPPIGVIERHSTDRVVTKLAHVSAAYRYLRTNLHQSIGTEQIAAHLGVSRSLLDRDFKNELGRSVSMEMKRLRLERIKRLLAQTDLTLEEIATQTGFSGKVAVSNFFRSQMGMNPGTFRSKHQLTSSVSQE